MQTKFVIAVGDGLNDVEMFREADWSYAMPKAPLEVRAAANSVLQEPATKSLAKIINSAAVGVIPGRIP
jgi:hydroxymethylpyrimidine pyrophosphatase-like HAD family hydrolase